MPSGRDERESLLAGLVQDVRYGLRSLGESKGFVAVAVVTLGLGIGASTALFSVIENVLMEPFPYPDSQRLMTIQVHDLDRSQPGGRGAFSGPEYTDIVEQNHVFDRAIGMSPVDVLYTTGEGTERFEGFSVNPGTFEFLGMPALLGRVMEPADYEPGAPPVFVLRYKVWMKNFGADPAIINKTFVLNDVPRTLIGIMPPRFGWWGADLWIPEQPKRAADTNTYAGAFPTFWVPQGHLRKDVSVKEAEVDFTVLAQRLSQAYPKEYPKHFAVKLIALTDSVVGQFRT